VAELQRVQAEIGMPAGVLSSSPDGIRGVVHRDVLLATRAVLLAPRALQDEYDATYGPGLVELDGALEPVD